MSRGIRCPRAWDNVLGEMLYSKAEQFDDSLMFRFDKHFETDQPVYMWPTGLKDRNGMEIYEGDIVETTHRIYDAERPHLNKVEFVDYCWRVVAINDDRAVDAPLGLYARDPDSIFIIGNIYENPELLEARSAIESTE